MRYLDPFLIRRKSPLCTLHINRLNYLNRSRNSCLKPPCTPSLSQSGIPLRRSFMTPVSYIEYFFFFFWRHIAQISGLDFADMVLVSLGG